MNIHESMSKILESEKILGNLFYNTFLNRHPDVQEYFEGVNMISQAALLTTALVIVERYRSLDSVAAKYYLRVLGSRHHDRKIPKELYAEWTEAMLDTLEQFHGKDWSDELSDEWRQAIDRAIERMFEGYEQHFDY